MGIEEIAELILLILFFIISPLIQRRRAQKQQESAPPPEPGAPADAEPGVPAPSPLAPPQPATTSDYAAYLAEGLVEQRRQVIRLRKELSSSPLHQLPELATLADGLQTQANTAIDATLRVIDGVVNPNDGKPRAEAYELSRVNEDVRFHVSQARVFASLFATLAEQRLNPGQRTRLVLFDKLLDRLSNRGRSGADSRRRWALLWDGDPATPSALLGPGTVGLAAVPKSRLGLAAGWTYLARGIGFDVLAEHPGLTDEIKRKSMVGPLADRPVAENDYARTAFDMTAALNAWLPNLTADIVGALLLGQPYAAGLVHSELARGLRPADAVTVRTESGRYYFEPPLMVRLAVVDEVLNEIGWANASNGLGLLAQRLDLPTEAVYVLPNRMTRRLMLDPLVGYMRQVAEALVGARFSSASDRSLEDLAGGRLSPMLQNKIAVAQRTFVDDQLPEGDPIVLLCAAILAEADASAHKHSYESSLIRALSERRVRRMRRRPQVGVSDRVLLRDALVLSEIL